MSIHKEYSKFYDADIETLGPDSYSPNPKTTVSVMCRDFQAGVAKDIDIHTIPHNAEDARLFFKNLFSGPHLPTAIQRCGRDTIPFTALPVSPKLLDPKGRVRPGTFLLLIFGAVPQTPQEQLDSLWSCVVKRTPQRDVQSIFFRVTHVSRDQEVSWEAGYVNVRRKECLFHETFKREWGHVLMNLAWTGYIPDCPERSRPKNVRLLKVYSDGPVSCELWTPKTSVVQRVAKGLGLRR